MPQRNIRQQSRDKKGICLNPNCSKFKEPQDIRPGHDTCAGDDKLTGKPCGRNLTPITTPKKSSKKWIYILIAILILAGIGVGVFFASSGDGSGADNGGDIKTAIMDSVKTEPVKTDTIKTEPVKTDTVQSEPAKSDSVTKESSKVDPSKPESGKEDTKEPPAPQPKTAFGGAATMVKKGNQYDFTFRRSYSLNLHNGDYLELRPGDRLLNATVKYGRLQQAELIRANGASSLIQGVNEPIR